MKAEGDEREEIREGEEKEEETANKTKQQQPHLFDCRFRVSVLCAMHNPSRDYGNLSRVIANKFLACLCVRFVFLKGKRALLCFLSCTLWFGDR